jgi:PAS domain S-box-containing protein
MKLWFRKSAADEVRTDQTVAAPEREPVKHPSPGRVDDLSDRLASPRVVTAEVPRPAVDTLAVPPSRLLFKQLLDGLYDATIITDVKGHIVNTNVRLTETIGYGADDVWDWPVSRMVPGITDALLARIRQGLSNERYVMIEARCVRKDQTVFQAEIAISQIEISKDGNLLFCIRNIERRQLAQQHLLSARRLLDHLPAAALACDASGSIKVANAAMARMLGYDKPDVMVGQPFSAFWREARAPEVLQRVLAGEPVKEPATVVNTRGKQLQLVITLTPDLDAHHKAVGFMAFFTSASVVSLAAR